MSTDTAGSAATVRVALAERSYDILIGPGLIAGAGTHLGPLLGKRRLLVLTDDTVAGIHLGPLMASLQGAGLRVGQPIVVPAGEGTKDFAHLSQVIEAMLESGIDRRTVLVALGGGVMGDLGGFAASIALRGIDFVQVPTTLLAQVDSSVGGKTGINTPQGKNLVGTFHQPLMVLADTGALDTLPRRELLAGYAEVVKYGLIDQPDFFAWLERNGTALLAGDAGARRHAIETSCRAKAAVVAADEREGGARALLNLGHTFGHALEAELDYDGRLLHGEAVAIGMVLAFELSAQVGLCPPADAARARALLAAAGLPVDARSVLGPDVTAERLLGHMAKDKKTQDGRLTFILARGIGRSFIAPDVPAEAVRTVLRRALDSQNPPDA
jgi:3-dehydroquinate synthase